MSGTTLSQNGATDTIYISQVGDNYYYNINNGDNSPLVFPDTGGISVINTNISASTNILKIIFTTDLTLSNTNQYFTCQSDGIQFGNSSLNLDGSVPIINITVNNYPGLIKNSSGYSYIKILNLCIDGTGYSTEQGWIAQNNFSGNTNYIINCSSKGDIYGGGIIGTLATNISIIGCHSEGSIYAYSGGIVSYRSLRNIVVSESYSIGYIDDSAGGIFGPEPNYGNTPNSIICSNCYTIGAIGPSAGGIFPGLYTIGDVIAINCYSLGSISISSGGIIGEGINNGFITNCYTNGSISTNAGGIVGNNSVGTPYIIQCYTSGLSSGNTGGIFAGSSSDGLNNYSETNNLGSGWNDINALSHLQGGWISLATNTPYILANIGYSPYSLGNIVYTNNTPSFNKLYTATITAGDSIYSVLQNRSNTYLLLNNTEPTIQIISTTGEIITTSNTPPDTYNFNVFCCPTTIYNAGPPYYNYSVTNVQLTVLEPPPPPPVPPPPPPQPLFPISQAYCPPIRSSGNVQLQSTYLASKQASYILNINGTNSCTQQVGNSNIYFNPPVGPITITNCGQQVVGSNAYLNITTRPKTQSQRIAAVQAAALLNQPRFATYNRWNPLPACPPLPALANSAGEPKPSLNTCLPNKNATIV